MWKDPIFSATVMVWSILAMDYVLSGGRAAKERVFFVGKHLLCLIVLCFSRNNGLYIGLVYEGVLFLLWILYRKRSTVFALKKMLVCTGCCLLVAGVITGHVYKKLGIAGEPVEGIGIFLNQMARVAAYDGEMSDADKAYMDELLPLEKYKDTYRPCVVDLLKWDAEFNQEFLNGHLPGFVKTYFSMFLKNPYCYAEAWMLNTYGYWALNRWELYQDGNNIYKGNLDDINHWDNYGILPHSLINSQAIKNIIRIADPMAALPVFTWLIFFLVFLIIKNRKWIWGIAIAPSIGLIATLMIATPHAYWQRYGLAQYYLIPVYIVSVFYLQSRKEEAL